MMFAILFPQHPKKKLKKIEAEIMSLDTSYCAQDIRVANTTSHVLFKYHFEGWTDHDNLDLDMTSDVIVEHGAKKAYTPRDYCLSSVQFRYMLMSLNKPKSKQPYTLYEHEGYKTVSYYSSDLVRCDHAVWTNDSTIQFGIHFMMSSYANQSAMMITPCSLTVLTEKGGTCQKRLTRRH